MIVPAQREDSVYSLPLSIRTRRFLDSQGIHTAGELMDGVGGLDLSGLTKKNQSDLNDVVDRLNRGVALSWVPEPDANDFLALPDLSLDELHLNKRTSTTLFAAGVSSLSDLSNATVESLVAAGLTEKAAQDVLDKLDQFRDANPRETFPTDAQSDWILRTAQEIAGCADISVRDATAQIAAMKTPVPTKPGAEYLRKVYQQPAILDALEKKVLSLLPETGDLPKKDVLEAIPILPNKKVLEDILLDMQDKDLIFLGETFIGHTPPSAVDFAQTVTNARNREVLMDRLRGATLEQTGSRFGITRERARQVTKMVLTNRPRLREDKYRDMFNTYEFTQEDFMTAFGEPLESYRYLELLRQRGVDRLPLADLLENEDIPLRIRRKVERAVYKNYVLVDGVQVLRSSAALARHTVLTHCEQLTTMEQFMERYRRVLAQCGLENDPDFNIEARTYENKLNACDYALWNQWRSFRKYILADYDYTPLLDTLGLENLEDQELSAMKLFRDNPDLMKQYDIRDEYELHNLLKKVWDRGDRVHFKKMPTISIGHPDRDQQVRDLLAQYAPISNMELAMKYEERYGAKSFTAMINYFKCIDCYLANGMYRMDLPSLPPERHQHMKEVLTEDFYRLSELKVAYLQEYPGSDPNDLNSFALKELGFRIYTDYVVNKRFPSATAYFREQLLGCGSGFSDMRSAAKRFTGIVAYASELYDMKAKREVVEYEPSMYISIERLEERGITVDNLEDYCNAAYAFAKSRHEDYFTVASLKSEGFHHALEESGFGGWFFSSLMAEDRDHFSSQRMGKTRVFRLGYQDVRLEDFFRAVLGGQGKMDLMTFQQKLLNTYGFLMLPDKIVTVIRNSKLYYDQVDRAIYTDIETLLDNLRA